MTLYHDFSILGHPTDQHSTLYEKNQQAKAPVILGYLARAIAECDHPSVAELFCADAFYATAALKFGAAVAVGLDRQSLDFDKAKHAQEALNLYPQFIQHDMTDLESIPGMWDIVINAGGLYHVPDPASVLTASLRKGRRFAIIQSVVTLEAGAPDFARYRHGCRMSPSGFAKMVEDTGAAIADQCANELPGNRRLRDRGSVYYLLRL